MVASAGYYQQTTTKPRSLIHPQPPNPLHKFVFLPHKCPFPRFTTHYSTKLIIFCHHTSAYFPEENPLSEGVPFKQLLAYINSSFPYQTRRLRKAEFTSPFVFNAFPPELHCSPSAARPPSKKNVGKWKLKLKAVKKNRHAYRLTAASSSTY